MKDSEKALLNALKRALSGQKSGSFEQMSDMFFCAQRHKVLPLLFEELTGHLSGSEQMILEQETHKTIAQFWRLFSLTDVIMRRLNEAGIHAAVLKGVSAAVYYPKMEYRKSGDIDILILARDCSSAERVLAALGCRKSEEQLSLHHISYISPENIEIEIHTLFAEPFDNAEANRLLNYRSAEALNHTEPLVIEDTVFQTLDQSYQALSLLLHMTSHYLRAGFGLKLLTDWVCFWNANCSETLKTSYESMAEEMGLKGFSDLVSASCIRYLGMNAGAAGNVLTEEDFCEQFMDEIFAGGEFGHDQKKRMVGLRKNRFSEYIREFHHQMRLNYPNAGRFVPVWPVLWTLTLARFLRNNRKLRGISTAEILHEAGRRGKLNEKIHLFEHKN